jgi:hypothetical protein
MVQPAAFSGTVGFLTLGPAQVGAVRNVGNVPGLIVSARKDGANGGDFDVHLGYRDAVFRLDRLAARAPLVLEPGETLLVGGRFYPQAEAGPNDPPRVAWVDFDTNQAAATVRVEISGRTVPSDAQASWAPDRINFGYVPVTTGRIWTRNALFESFGQTPLLIESLEIEDQTLGFDWGIFEEYASLHYQLYPGDAMIVQISYRPVGAGPVSTRLIARTNAGALALELSAEAVQG